VWHLLSIESMLMRLFSGGRAINGYDIMGCASGILRFATGLAVCVAGVAAVVVLVIMARK
jgi:hypothetical protein